MEGWELDKLGLREVSDVTGDNGCHGQRYLSVDCWKGNEDEWGHRLVA